MLLVDIAELLIAARSSPLVPEASIRLDLAKARINQFPGLFFFHGAGCHFRWQVEVLLSRETAFLGRRTRRQ